MRRDNDDDDPDTDPLFIRKQRKELTMATRIPTAAQVAARKTFAEMAKAGAFMKRPAAPSRAKANPAVKRAENPAKRGTVMGKRIAKLVEEGYPFKQAEAIAIHERGSVSASTIRYAQKHAREILNYPAPMKVTKRGIVKANPLKRRVAPKKNPSMPAHRAPASYAVHKALKSGDAGALLGKFPTLAAAKEYAQAYATAHQCAVGIVGKS